MSRLSLRPDKPVVRSDGPVSGEALRLKDLRVTLPTEEGLTEIVRGVDVVLDAGRTLGLVGESGSGKSMTALALCGLLPSGTLVTAKEHRLGGRDVTAMDSKQRRQLRWGEISIIFQDPMTSLNPVLTVGRQITEVLELHRCMSRRAASAQAEGLLDLVRLPSPRASLDRYPHELSGGMRQRVMIAMAVSCEPRVLVADEPTTALDVTVQSQILQLLRDVQQEVGMAMLLITHDLGVVAGLADVISVMYAGQVIESAETAVLLSSPRHPYTRALLRSAPSLLRDPADRPVPIGGAPPEFRDLPHGCAFATRCSLAQASCSDGLPDLLFSRGHGVACFVENAGERA